MIKMSWENILKIGNYIKDAGPFYELEASPPIRVDKVKMMAALKDYKKVVGNRTNISCDCLAISGGWTPTVHLFTQSGGKLKFRDKDQVFLPDTVVSDQLSVGSCNGDFELDQVIENTISS